MKFIERHEQKPLFDAKASLEKIEGVSNVQKLELDTEYFKWAKDNIESSELYQTIKTNYEALEAFSYKYVSGDHLVAGYLWMPRGTIESLPLAIWNRGGTNEAGSIGDQNGKRGPLYSNIPAELAKQGTIVVASEYSGGLNSEGEDEWGGADLNDVVRLKEIAGQLPICKSEKAIVAGVSRGGMMSYMLAAKEPWVKAVISLSGTADLVMSGKERPEMQKVFNKAFGGSEEEMKKRSAAYFYEKIPKDLPLLIVQGEKDTRVSVEQVRTLTNLLKKSGHTVEYHEFPKGDHFFYEIGSPERKETLEIIKQFLKTQL